MCAKTDPKSKMFDLADINLDTSTCKIGFIGAGNMSMAIIKGLIEHGNALILIGCVFFLN